MAAALLEYYKPVRLLRCLNATEDTQERPTWIHVRSRFELNAERFGVKTDAWLNVGIREPNWF